MEFHLSSFRHCKVLEKPNLSLFPGWHFGGQAGSALPALLTGGRNVRFWQDLKCYPKWSKGQADLGWCGVYLKILFLYLYQVYISLFLDFRLLFFFFPPDITRTWINTKPFFSCSSLFTTSLYASPSAGFLFSYIILCPLLYLLLNFVKRQSFCLHIIEEWLHPPPSGAGWWHQFRIHPNFPRCLTTLRSPFFWKRVEKHPCGTWVKNNQKLQRFWDSRECALNSWKGSFKQLLLMWVRVSSLLMRGEGWTGDFEWAPAPLSCWRLHIPRSGTALLCSQGGATADKRSWEASEKILFSTNPSPTPFLVHICVIKAGMGLSAPSHPCWCLKKSPAASICC